MATLPDRSRPPILRTSSPMLTAIPTSAVTSPRQTPVLGSPNGSLQKDSGSTSHSPSSWHLPVIPSDSLRLISDVPVCRVTCLPPGDRVVTVSRNRQLRFYSTITGTSIAEFSVHRAPIVGTVVLSAHSLVSVDASCTVAVWDTRELSSVSVPVLTRLPYSAHATCVTAADACVYVGHSDGTVTALRVGCTAEDIGMVTSFGTRVLSLSVQNSRLAVVTQSQVHLLSLPSAQKLLCANVKCLSVELGGTWIVTSADPTAGFSAITVFSVANGKPVNRIYAHRGSQYAIRLSHSGELVLSCSHDRTVRLHAISSGQQVWGARLPSPGRDACVLPDGRIAAALHTGGTVVLRPPIEVRKHLKYPSVKAEYSSANESRASANGAQVTAIRQATGDNAKAKKLQRLLERALSGSVQPRASLHALTKQSCHASHAEWRAAHQLLMLAVENGEVARSPLHNGLDAWWQQQLYVCDVVDHAPTDTDRQRMITALREAENRGVLDCAAAVVGDMALAARVDAAIADLRAEYKRLYERVKFLENLVAVPEVSYNQPRETTAASANMAKCRRQTFDPEPCGKMPMSVEDTIASDPVRSPPPKSPQSARTGGCSTDQVSSVGDEGLKIDKRISSDNCVDEQNNPRRSDKEVGDWLISADDCALARLIESIQSGGLSGEELRELLQRYKTRLGGISGLNIEGKGSMLRTGDEEATMPDSYGREGRMERTESNEIIPIEGGRMVTDLSERESVWTLEEDIDIDDCRENVHILNGCHTPSTTSHRLVSHPYPRARAWARGLQVKCGLDFAEGLSGADYRFPVSENVDSCMSYTPGQGQAFSEQLQKSFPGDEVPETCDKMGAGSCTNKGLFMVPDRPDEQEKKSIDVASHLDLSAEYVGNGVDEDIDVDVDGVVVDDEQEGYSVEDDEVFPPRHFREMRVSAATARAMRPELLAQWWAAFTMGFRERWIDTYASMCNAFGAFLREEDVDAEILAVGQACDEVVAAAATFVEQTLGNALRVGWRIRLRRFVELIVDDANRSTRRRSSTRS